MGAKSLICAYGANKCMECIKIPQNDGQNDQKTYVNTVNYALIFDR